MNERVLTADLQWKPAGDLLTDEELFAFDEQAFELGGANVPRRRFRYAKVLRSVPVRCGSIKLEMSDGSVVTASKEHPWLTIQGPYPGKYKWGNYEWLQTDQIASDIRNGKKRFMHRFVDTWETLQGRDIGWLAGLYDGEGHLAFRKNHHSQSRVLMTIGLSQKGGLVLEQARILLARYGFNVVEERSSRRTGDVYRLQNRNGQREVLRILGSVRPIRLIDKFVTELRKGNLARELRPFTQPLEIIAAYDFGEQWCAGLETTTSTYLCEGFGAHNSKRIWLDSVDEAAAQHPHAPRPTRVERWVGKYFTEWLEEAQRIEQERMKNPNPEVMTHPGFGAERAEALERAWAQWISYVCWANEGSPEDDDEDRSEEESVENEV